MQSPNAILTFVTYAGAIIMTSEGVGKGKNNEAFCERCQGLYIKKVFWQKYCSQACKVIAWGLKEANKSMKKNGALK